MCRRVARHHAYGRKSSLAVIIEAMPEHTHTFARRARRSSKAIMTAVILTLAAAVALLVASQQQESGVDIKIFSPVSDAPLIKTSGSAVGALPISH